MRVAYLVSQYPASSHTFIRREIEAVRALGIDVRTFSVRRPSEAERASGANRAAFEQTVYLLPASAGTLVRSHLKAVFGRPAAYLSTLRLALSHRAPGLRALMWSFFHFAEAIVLARTLGQMRVAHLHNHFANSGATVGLLATHFLRLSWSLTLHGISETDYPAGLLLARKIAAARFVACVSWFGRAQAMRMTPPEHWHKMSIVRCGIDLATLPSAVPRQERSTAPRVVCVGRLSPEKGHLGLLEAFARVRHEGTSVRLVLVGDGPERERIEKRAAVLGLSDVVTFTGRLDESATLFEIAAAQILVLPSFMEGLPIVLMEAMALGVTVVASRVAGVPELIEDRKDGLLFRPSDWDDLYEKMTQALEDALEHDQLAAAARERIISHYQISHAVRPLVALLRGIEDR